MTQTTLPPLEFIDKMQDWMSDPTGRPFDQSWQKEIAQRAWNYFVEWRKEDEQRI